jgi:hypothetical protein
VGGGVGVKGTRGDLAQAPRPQAGGLAEARLMGGEGHIKRFHFGLWKAHTAV